MVLFKVNGDTRISSGQVYAALFSGALIGGLLTVIWLAQLF